MPKISVVIITFNEEKNIDRCLASVKSVADEIVVVDSFSTDKTEDICKEHNVRFIQHAFKGHIEQKNWALSQASYPHVLSLDADEALTPTLISSVLEVKKEWKCDGYSMNRLNNYCGQWIRYCGWYPDRKLRLWDVRKGQWGGTNPHDEVIMNEGAKVKRIDGDLLHYTYYTTEQHDKQLAYFSDIAANAAFEKGKRSSSFKAFYKSKVKFFKGYVLKLGFLDGHYGYVICKKSAYETYLKYIKLRDLCKKEV